MAEALEEKEGIQHTEDGCLEKPFFTGFFFFPILTQGHFLTAFKEKGKETLMQERHSSVTSWMHPDREMDLPPTHVL